MHSVVTPSLNMLAYLKRCSASVADQGVAYEHIVMDGGSTDGTGEWLRHNPRILSSVAKDKGMYDAVNKGFRLARGTVVSHLNCDEQYLPGALSFVHDYFERHPDVDIIFGDLLIVRPDGTLICYRKGTWPSPALIVARMYMCTTATFIRRRVIDAGEFYDDSYTNVGDLEFYLRLIRKRYRIKHISRFLSAFTLSGHNLMLRSEVVAPERARLLRDLPWWMRRFDGIWTVAGWGAKFLSGAYFPPAELSYSLFMAGDAVRRTDFHETRPPFRWQAPSSVARHTAGGAQCSESRQ